jgi:hypothetical protein
MTVRSTANNCILASAAAGSPLTRRRRSEQGLPGRRGLGGKVRVQIQGQRRWRPKALFVRLFAATASSQ